MKEYDNVKRYVREFMVQADYEGCIDFCTSALHNIDTYNSTYSSNMSWYLHHSIAECLYKTNIYDKSIIQCNKALLFSVDIEFEIKTKWVMALCYTDLNYERKAVDLVNECIDFYTSESRLDMTYVLNIILAKLKNDENIVETAIENIQAVTQTNVENPFNIDYTYYLDEAYYCLSNIYMNKQNGLMAYKAWLKIINKKDYTKGDFTA